MLIDKLGKYPPVVLFWLNKFAIGESNSILNGPLYSEFNLRD